MSFFSRKKKADNAVGDASASPSPSAQSAGYPGAVAAAQQAQGQGGSGGGYQAYPVQSAYAQYPQAVAGYQPPSFHIQQQPPPSAYQPSAVQAYSSPQTPPQGQSQFQSPPPPQNPHASGYPFPGGYQASPPQQSQGQAQQFQQAPQPQQGQAYPGYSSQPYMGGYQSSASPSASSSSPQQPSQLPHLYHNGYPQQAPQQFSGYGPVKPATGGSAMVGSASPSSGPSSLPPLSEMKPWENPQQAAARLARAEASEQRVSGSAGGSMGGKQKTWSQYQEIEKAEREKQQRIQQRQQQPQVQPQQPPQPQDGYAVSDAPSYHHQQPQAGDHQQPQPFHVQKLQSWSAPPWSEAPSSSSSQPPRGPQYQQQPHSSFQQSIPDLLTFPASPRSAEEPRSMEPATPRAGVPHPPAEEDDDPHGDGDHKLVDGYILRPENEVEEEEEVEVEVEEEEEEEEDEEDPSSADEKKSAQLRLEEEHEGQEGQSWQQIGKGKRPVDEFDTDTHGEGQTKEIPVAHLIDFAEKQGESLQQPLLSPASAAQNQSPPLQSGFPSPAAAAPTPAASHFDFVSDNSQALLSGSLAASAGKGTPSGDTVVLEAPKRVKKKKQHTPAPAASVGAISGGLADLSINGSHASPQPKRSLAAAQPRPPQALQQQTRQPQPQPQSQYPQHQQQPQPAQDTVQAPHMQAPTPAEVTVSPAAPSAVSPPMMASPYAQRLYAGFAFQLYTDTSSHDLFLFYEPNDGPLGTLYWCQPGRREKSPQHSMVLHEITHSVLGKHHFPTSNPRATAAHPPSCFTLYDKSKRLDMCADSGANREEFLHCLEQVIKESRQGQVQQPQPQAAQAMAVSAPSQQVAAAVRSQPAHPVPAQVVASHPSQAQQINAAQPQMSGVSGYYAPSSMQAALQQSPNAGYPPASSYPYPQPQPFNPSQMAGYPAAMQAQPFAPQFAPSAGFVPGMSRPAPPQQVSSQPLYAPQAHSLQGYGAMQAPLQQPLPPPPQLVQENLDLIKPVHAGVGCDSCKTMPIKDVRYKCTLCFNFDLCEKCERKGRHPRSHPLIKMYACGRARDVGELFHRAQYKELQQQQLMRKPGQPNGGSILTEDVRFNEYHKDMLSRVMGQAHTLPPPTMSHLVELLVQLMTSTEESRDLYCHIVLRDEKTQRLLLPFPVALDLLRLCGFDYVQTKSSGDHLSFQGMERFDELWFDPHYKLTVVETVVEKLLRMQQ